MMTILYSWQAGREFTWKHALRGTIITLGVIAYLFVVGAFYVGIFALLKFIFGGF